jgi:hypothetical protein
MASYGLVASWPRASFVGTDSSGALQRATQSCDDVMPPWALSHHLPIGTYKVPYSCCAPYNLFLVSLYRVRRVVLFQLLNPDVLCRYLSSTFVSFPTTSLIRSLSLLPFSPPIFVLLLFLPLAAFLLTVGNLLPVPFSMLFL